jgi:hypothetical protein
MTGPTREKTTRDGRKVSGRERKEGSWASAGPKGGNGSAARLEKREKEMGCQWSLCQKGNWAAGIEFKFWFKEMRFKSKVLNISKPNLNWIKNGIKSNQLFGNFSNLKNWSLI